MFSETIAFVLTALAVMLPPSAAYAFAHYVQLQKHKLELAKQNAQEMQLKHVAAITLNCDNIEKLQARLKAVEELSAEQQKSLNTLADRY